MSDPLKELKQQGRFYDFLHVAWGIIELRADESILKAYNELAEKSIIAEGLRDFLAFDNYLSPLTAHPLNSILKILFSKPF